MRKSSDEINLKDLVIIFTEYKRFIFKRAFIILVFSFLFFVFGLFFAFFSEEKYNAELTFLVESNQSSLASTGSSIAGLAAQFGLESGENTTFSQNNVIELLRSRGVIQSALMESVRLDGKKDLLIEHYLEINDIRDSWSDIEFLNKLSFHDNITYFHDSIISAILPMIQDDLDISLTSGESNIITLSYISSHERFAKFFVEKLINQMSRMYILNKTANANNTLDFLQNRSDSVFSELENAEKELARVQDINARIIKASGRIKEIQLMRQVEVLNVMYLELVKNLEISKLTLLNKTPIINIIDTPILPLKTINISSFYVGLFSGFLGFLVVIIHFIFKKFFKDNLAS